MKCNKNSKKTKFKTTNGVYQTDRLIKIKAKVLDIEDHINVFIIDSKNFDHDFLMGLDCIKKFRLTQNEKLEIEQKDSESNEEKCQINFNEHVETNAFNVLTNNLNNCGELIIKKLIDKYKNIFAKDKYDVGTVKHYEARIDLIIDKYCSKRPYKCTIEDKKEIEKQISKLLKRNLIEESYSPFAAPVTLAFKKDENRKSRLCIDFRDLNKLIIHQSQPFPLIEDLVLKTRNCKYFSKLDVNSAFWSIPLRIEDRRKTAFVTQEGHFQWTCLPFGLKTASAIFQRILSNIIRKHNLSKFAVNYIDDILVFLQSFGEHIEHLTQLLEAIMKEGFRLKLSKCTFALDSVQYLGHIIGQNEITPIKDNLIAIKNFPVPKTQKNVRQFLGKINFYNEYVPKISSILEPLHNLLRKNQEFIWSEDCQKAFDYMKNFLSSQPVLSIFDRNLPIHIYTDASLQGIGAVLKQPQLNKNSGIKKPVAYFSRKLTESQKKKKAIYLKCIAIREAVKFWQHWLIGRHFIVFSDHKPLEKMNIKARTDEELGDLTYYLSQFDFELKYFPGKDNLEADCLSRNLVLEPQEDEEDKLRIVNLIQLQDIREDQARNKNIKLQKERFIHKDNLYYKKSKYKEKIILSEELCKKLIEDTHKEFCHIGVNQMRNKIMPHYKAINILENIKKTCKNCKICIMNKARRQNKIGLLSHLGPAKKPFEIISIDTIGGFGGSRSTKKYLHPLIDHFTRFAYILTSKTQNASDFIKLTEKVVESHDVQTLLTDQYPGNNSKEYKDYLEQNKIKMIFTGVNAPFSNGLNERLNQTLVNKIRCVPNEENNKYAWTTIAHKCVEKYNETEHTVTKFSPKHLLYGEDTSTLPNELKMNKSINSLENDRKIAFQNSLRYHDYNKKIYDRNRKEYNFEVGDLVYIENGNRLNRKKLDELRIGPYSIIEKISNSMYKINTGYKKSESSLFHISALTPSSIGTST